MKASATSLLAPVRASERVEIIDILRGFALLGILLVNFEGSSQGFLKGINSTVGEGLDLLAEGSFYPLFSFLFGLGFAIQLSRAGEKGSAIVPLFFRRMLVLLLIGTVHAVLIWKGDILVEYALLGLLLIPLHRLSSRGLWIAIAALFCFSIGSERIDTAIRGWSGEDPIVAELAQGYEQEEARLIRNGQMRANEDESLAAHIELRWSAYGRTIVKFTDWRWILRNDIIMLFLLGVLVGKRRYLERLNEHKRGFTFLGALGLLVAVAGYFLQDRLFGAGSEVNVLAWMTSNYGATAFYVALIALLVVAGGRAARALRVFSDVGRMALTNYLMQSVVMTLLLYSYGFDLADGPGTTLWLLMHLAFFFFVQVPLSRFWLRRYRFGPAEWLWRSLTYGNLQPMRRTVPAVDTASKLEPA